MEKSEKRKLSKNANSATKVHTLAYLLLAPILIWLILTILIPLFQIIKMSFFSIGIIGTEATYAGLQNYINILTSNSYWKSLCNSGLWLLGNALFQTFLAFATALWLTAKFKFVNQLRNWIIIPWIIPTVSVVIIWQWIFNGSYGVLNYVLKELNLISDSLNLLGNPSTALITVIFINSWKWFPFIAIILIAGMNTISEDLYDAASVDGANVWQKFWNITFPNLAPILFAIGLVGNLWIFNIFDTIWLLTEGGPSDVTTTAPIFIYEKAFTHFSLSEAATASVITSIILFIFVAIFVKIAAPKNK